MTSREDAADVVMTLMHAKLIGNGPDIVKAIERELGVTRLDLLAAISRNAPAWDLALTGPPAQPIRPPSTPAPDQENHATRPGSSTELPPERTMPKPPARRSRRKPGPRPQQKRPASSTRQRTARINQSTGADELWCTGHDNHPAHWAHIDEFLVRADRPHKRATFCHEGRKLYQRARFVSVRALAEMSSAGFALTLDIDSTLIGIECKACGRPFVTGDDIEGEGHVRHSTCNPTTGQGD